MGKQLLNLLLGCLGVLAACCSLLLPHRCRQLIVTPLAGNRLGGDRVKSTVGRQDRCEILPTDSAFFLRVICLDGSVAVPNLQDEVLRLVR